MKKKGSVALIVVGVIVAIAVALIAFYVGCYNSIIRLEEDTTTKLSDIKVQLERRADLIPNLVNTVKGFMEHEEKVINDITDAREKMLGANTVEEMSEANNQLSAALRNLNVVVENYPDLKANTNFISLQDELAGTENRIATARRDYNDSVKTYNSKIKTFPTLIVAGMMGKEEKSYFEVSDPSKEEVPTVDFSK
jgi:LemA protein